MTTDKIIKKIEGFLEIEKEKKVSSFTEKASYLIRTATYLGFKDLKEQLERFFESNPVTNNSDLDELLMLAIDHNQANIIELLLTKGANPDQKDKDGMTPLMLAISMQRWDIVNMLLPVTHDLNAMLPNGLSALSMAVALKNIDLERTLRSKGCRINGMEVPETLTIKQFKRKEKEALLERGPIAPLPRDKERYTAVEAIVSQIYCEDVEMGRELYHSLNQLYENVVSLRPLLDVMALAALGLHNQEEEKQKKFKIIVASPDTLERMSGLRKDYAGGFYTKKNTCFVSIRPSITFSILMHEACHFVMQILFKNDSKPYAKKDALARQEMQEIISKLKGQLNSPIVGNDSTADQQVFTKIKSLFDGTGYPLYMFAIELIVIVPEFIALHSPDKGEDWLNKYLPGLTTYYSYHIVSALEEYLAEHHADQYLARDNKGCENPSNAFDRKAQAIRNQITFFKELPLSDIEKTTDLSKESEGSPGLFKIKK